MLADVFLRSIMDYSLLHCSLTITDALIEGTRLGLPAVKSYLDSRVMTAEHSLLAPSHPKLNKNYLRKCDAIEGEYGYVVAPIWGRTYHITGTLIPPMGAKHPTTFNVLDLPEFYQNSKRGL